MRQEAKAFQDYQTADCSLCSRSSTSQMYKLLVLSFFSTIAVGQMTQSFRDHILSDHNEKRRLATNAANMIELRYDMILERTAQNYLAKGCAGGFQHNPNRGCDYTALGGTNGGSGTCASVGENWYSGAPDNTTGVEVVIGGAVAQWTDGRCSSWASPPLRCSSYWCSEKQNFYQTGSDSFGACTQLSGEVLHYTQVMWPTTTHVGCSYTVACGTLCNYAMAGNVNLPPLGSVVESNVWKIGTPCSSCPSGYTTCNNGLCAVSSSSSTTTTRPPATTTPSITSCAADTINKPINGNVGTCGSRTTIGSTCLLSCNTGYTLTAGSLSRQCTSSGAYSSVTAVCSAVTCPGDSTTKPVNGNAGTCSNSATYGQACQMACNSGFVLSSGSLVRTCGASGAYSSVSATCTGVATTTPPTTTPRPTTAAPTTTRPPTTTPAPTTRAPTTTPPTTPTPPTTTPTPVSPPVTGSYCTSGPQSVDDTEFGPVQLIGEASQIKDNDGCPGTIGPSDFTALSVTLALGQTYTLNYLRTTCGDYFAAIIGAWIDWDQDRVWETSELLFPFFQKIGQIASNFTVPTTAKLGTTRLRLQVQEIGSTTTTTIDPCAMFNWGDTKDYTVVVVAAPVKIQCPGNADIKPINGVAGTCLTTMSYGQVCTQRCNNGYTLTSGSLSSSCGASGSYDPSTAICTATGALSGGIIASQICLPDKFVPENGDQGTCIEVGTVGSTCLQTCNPGFQLKNGTSLVRECTSFGYSNSTAICEKVNSKPAVGSNGEN